MNLGITDFLLLSTCLISKENNLKIFSSYHNPPNQNIIPEFRDDNLVLSSNESRTDTHLNNKKNTKDICLHCTLSYNVN